jgi:hypothetical protein
MRRLVCGCGVWLAVSAGMAAAATTTSPRASLSDSVCQASSSQLSRVVGITAVMRPLVGTGRMALLFQLQQRPVGGVGFTYLQGQNLGRWIHPTKPRNLGQRQGDVWMVNKPVVNLPGPDYYRFRVTFRWRSRSGRVLGQAVRLGPPCYQHG